MKKNKKQKLALFRFGVISGILNVKDTGKGEREKRIGEVTSKEWDIPYSGRSYIGRSTVRDWLKRYEESGCSLESLWPQDRCDQGKVRCMDEETEATLLRLRREFRAASLPVLLRRARQQKLLPPEFSASSQSIYRLFKRHGLDEPLVLRASTGYSNGMGLMNPWWPEKTCAGLKRNCPTIYGSQIVCMVPWLSLMENRGSPSALL